MYFSLDFNHKVQLVSQIKHLAAFTIYFNLVYN